VTAKGSARMLFGLALLATLVPGGVSPAGARPGRLDAGSSPGGTVTTSFGLTSDDQAVALAVQPDGRLVVAGTRSPSPAQADFVLARYMSDGSLDPSFGSGGKVTTTFRSGGGSNEASGLALQPDGKIVVAGTKCRSGEDCGPSARGAREFALARYRSDGTLDANFGSAGKVTTPVGTGNTARGVTLQPDGKIVVVGSAVLANSGEDFAVARYDADGTLDTSFGAGGKVTTTFGATSSDGAEAVVLQRDGKIVAGGHGSFGCRCESDFALARYTADGTLDPSFGSSGKVTTTIGLNRFAFANTLALQADGKIVLAGEIINGGFELDFALARYTADGSLDQSFGSGGTVTTDLEPDAVVQAVAFQPDGKIVAAGYSHNDPHWTNFALTRYKADGSLDQSFGSGGKVTTVIGARGSQARSVALQPDGKIVAAGDSYTCTYGDFTLARYDANGTLDAGFGSGTTRCIVPNVKGKTVAVAKRAIRSRDCPLGRISSTFSRSVPKGRVISQQPRASAQCSPEVKVALKVSKGKKKPRARIEPGRHLAAN
jgi:uncharacterized delta-60 repeat protein